MRTPDLRLQALCLALDLTRMSRPDRHNGPSLETVFWFADRMYEWLQGPTTQHDCQQH